MLYTTYQMAENAHACERGLKQWVEHIGGIEKLKKTDKIPLTDILDVLGLMDCLWVMGNACNGDTKIILVKFAIACANRVLIHYEKQYPNDNRPRKAIAAAQNYLLHPNQKSAAAAAAAADTAARSAAAHTAAYFAADAAAAAATTTTAAHTAAHAAHAAAAHTAAAAYFSADIAAAEHNWQTAKLKELLEGE